MAVPSNLTPTQIVTEALKWGGRTVPTSAQITDGLTLYMAAVKSDLTASPRVIRRCLRARRYRHRSVCRDTSGLLMLKRSQESISLTREMKLDGRARRKRARPHRSRLRRTSTMRVLRCADDTSTTPRQALRGEARS